VDIDSLVLASERVIATYALLKGVELAQKALRTGSSASPMVSGRG